MTLKKAKEVLRVSAITSATVHNNVHLSPSDRKSNSLGSAKIGINPNLCAKTCRDPVMQLNHQVAMMELGKQWRGYLGNRQHFLWA